MVVQQPVVNDDNDVLVCVNLAVLEALFLLLLALPGTTNFSREGGGLGVVVVLAFCCCCCCKGFGDGAAVVAAALFLVGNSEAGRQIPELDKQSSTNIESHSKLTSTSCKLKKKIETFNQNNK